MFDLAWSEIAVIGVVAVLVLGPKELPAAMRTMAKVMRKMRNLSSELQGHINEVVREAELDEVRQQIQKLSTTNITAEVTKAVDPTGELTSALDPNTASASTVQPGAQPEAQSAATEFAAPEVAPVSENAAPSASAPPSSGPAPGSNPAQPT